MKVFYCSLWVSEWTSKFYKYFIILKSSELRKWFSKLKFYELFESNLKEAINFYFSKIHISLCFSYFINFTTRSPVPRTHQIPILNHQTFADKINLMNNLLKDSNSQANQAKHSPNELINDTLLQRKPILSPNKSR